MHCLHNYRFCYENELKKLSASLLRRMQIQSKKKIHMSRFINANLESDLDSDSESKSDTELKSESEEESETE